MATLDELRTNLESSAQEYLDKAIEGDLLNCVDLFIEACAADPLLAVQTPISFEGTPPFPATNNAGVARAMGMSTTKAPEWVTELQTLVAQIRQQRGLARPAKPKAAPTAAP